MSGRLRVANPDFEAKEQFAVTYQYWSWTLWQYLLKRDSSVQENCQFELKCLLLSEKSHKKEVSPHLATNFCSCIKCSVYLARWSQEFQNCHQIVRWSLLDKTITDKSVFFTMKTLIIMKTSDFYVCSTNSSLRKNLNLIVLN